MLADVRRDDRVPILGQFIQPLDDMLRLDRSIRFLLIGERMGLLPFANLIPPGLAQFLLIAVHRRRRI